jgi:S-DNA-T family DNA segregation ATPase FtsK/SpoIIIE
MLLLSPSSHKLNRAQGTLVDDREIRRVVRFLKDVASPSFERQLVQLRGPGGGDEERLAATENNSSASLKAAQEDPLFDRAVEIVLQTKRGSVSLLQRRLAIGYTRASRLIDLMGIAGIIGEHKGSVAREVLITPEEWEAIKQMAEEMAAQQGVEYPRVESADEEADQQLLFPDSEQDVRGGADEAADDETGEPEDQYEEGETDEASGSDGEEEDEYEEEEDDDAEEDWDDSAEDPEDDSEWEWEEVEEEVDEEEDWDEESPEEEGSSTEDPPFKPTNSAR